MKTTVFFRARRRLLAAIAIVTSVAGLHPAAARADVLDDVLSILSTAGVVDPAVVEAKPMIQCLVDGKSVEACAELAAGQAQGFVPNDPKIQKVVDVFHAVKANDWLEVFLLAGEQVVCSLVPGGAVKDLFCGEIFDVAEPVITSAYEAVMDGNVLKLVSAVGVEYACDLLPSAPGANELCGVLGEIVAGVAKGVETAVGALGSLAEDIAGQTQHMPVEQYYLKYWRAWLHYTVVKKLHTGDAFYLYAGAYASGSTSCSEYFDSHKMSESNADKVCGVMKKRFLEEVEEVTKVWQAFPAAFFQGWAAPKAAGWAAAYHGKVDEYAQYFGDFKGLNQHQHGMYLLKSNAPFKKLLQECHKQAPLAMPAIPSVVHNADKAIMGTAEGWACLRSAKLLADALLAEKAKINSLESKVTSLGCSKLPAPSGPGKHFRCETYAAFQACEALYPGGESQAESLCWVNGYDADPVLAQEIVDELGAKRCRTVQKPFNNYKLFDVRCDRPWKQAMCESLVDTLSAGSHSPPSVACLMNNDRGFAAAKAEAASIVKKLNVVPTGMGSVDPGTGVTSGVAMHTNAKCRSAENEWDPLRLHCAAESANQELAAALPTCLPDGNKDGADAPCYDGPMTNAPAPVPSVATPAMPFPDNNFSRIIDVEIDFFDRNGPGWVRADGPTVGGMVAVRCIYEHGPVRALDPDTPWSIGFLADGRLVDEAAGSGPVDTAGRVTRTWYGKLLAGGPVEFGCARTIDEEPDAGNRLLRTIEVPANRLAREQRGPRITVVTPREAAAARGTAPTLDVRFAHFAGIKQTKSGARFRETAPVTTAIVGDALAVDCSYVASMDAPNGEPVVLDEWNVVIEQDGRPVRSASGDSKLVSMRGVSSPGSLVHRFTPREPGELTFRCRLDTGQAIAEADENNNELELELTVTSLRRASPR